MLPQSRRRWSLSLPKRFALLVLVLCVCLGWLGRQIAVVDDRSEMRTEVARRGGLIGFPADAPNLPLVRRGLGDRPVASVNLMVGSFSQQEINRIVELFPEATVNESDIIDGPSPSIGQGMLGPGGSTGGGFF